MITLAPSRSTFQPWLDQNQLSLASTIPGTRLHGTPTSNPGASNITMLRGLARSVSRKRDVSSVARNPPVDQPSTPCNSLSVVSDAPYTMWCTLPVQTCTATPICTFLGTKLILGEVFGHPTAKRDSARSGPTEIGSVERILTNPYSAYNLMLVRLTPQEGLNYSERGKKGVLVMALFFGVPAVAPLFPSRHASSISFPHDARSLSTDR